MFPLAQNTRTLGAWVNTAELSFETARPEFALKNLFFRNLACSN